MASGRAVVKSVLSGDSLVLSGKPKNGPPPEIQITLSALMAPRLGRDDGTRPDEPFAFESREFLRKLCIGKAVDFQVDSKRNERNSGDVKLDGVSLIQIMVEAGWSKLKENRDGAEGYEELKQLEASAQAAKKGVWNTEPGAVSGAIRSAPAAIDSHEFLKSVKGQDLPAVIEYFRDGHSFYVYLVNQKRKILMHMAGIQCPRMNLRAEVPPSAPQAADAAPPAGEIDDAAAAPAPQYRNEAFAAQARSFVELRVLHRDVTVKLLGCDRGGAFLGTVSHPAGNIAELLLREGFARMVDWSVGYLPTGAASAMRSLERAAKAKKLRIWHGYIPPVITGVRQFSGTVCEVVSGDTLVVLSGEEGARTSRRVSLASVRTPRLGIVRRGEKDAPYAFEALELLRTRLVGRAVDVEVEYTRANGPSLAANGGEGKAPTPDERVYASVFLTVGKGAKARRVNVGEQLLAEGLGETVRHRADEERSLHFDVLQGAEQKARASNKGLHGSRPSKERRTTELVGQPAKARQFMPYLKRDRFLRATVEYVYSGSRLKLFIHKENCTINFAFMGVTTPDFPRASAGPNAAAEPFAQEAKDFTYFNLMQREVEVAVDTVNKGGTAIGELWVGNGGKRRAFAVELLRRGLARCTDFAGSCIAKSEMTEAEAEAQGSLLAVWENYEAELAAAKEAAKPPMEETVTVRVSEIRDANSFYVQIMNTEEEDASVELQQVEAMMSLFRDMVSAGESSSDIVGGAGNPVGEAKKGMFVAAPFDEGNGITWFRARVESVLSGGRARVLFIDYGNSDVLPVSELRTVDAPYLHIPPQALPARLAYVTAPSMAAGGEDSSTLRLTQTSAADVGSVTVGSEHGSNAAQYLSQLVWGKLLVAKVHDREGQSNSLLVTLEDPTVTLSVNECLVGEGLAIVDATAVGSSRALSSAACEKSLSAAQAGARKGRLNMWQYGDIVDEDDLKPQRKGGAWGRR